MTYSNGIARYYDLLDTAPDGQDAAAELLSSLVQRGARVLDIGAGVGKTAFALAGEGFNVTALEPDPEMFSVLLARLALRRDLHRSITPIPAAAGFGLDGKFDLVGCFAVVHLLAETERAALVHYAREQVRDGGKVVLEIPVASSARVARAWHRVAECHPGDTVVEQHAMVEPLGGGWWNTHWRFRHLYGTRVLDDTLQVFRWHAASMEECAQLIAIADLEVVEEYGGLDRAPFVPGESRQRVVVMRAP
jgi:SAM-dependent methyltransferase